MGAPRGVTIVLGSALVAAAALASLDGCKNGEYDGSYDGSFDGGSQDGSAVSRTVAPEKVEVVTSTDGVFDVTFAAGTFSAPAKITITSRGERTLDTGLIVPIYEVAADQTPAKTFQVVFHGAGNLSGSPDLKLPLAALESGGSFAALSIVGSSNGGNTGSFWGLTKVMGTFSLAVPATSLSTTFAEVNGSCTARCCAQNGNGVTAFAGGCYCASGPDLACFLACTDLDGAAARCTNLAASASFGNVDCRPLGATSCPGPGCNGYPGNCLKSIGPMNSSAPVCCVNGKNAASCATSPQICPGFAARCTAASPCPSGTTCCVFDAESYCAASCPAGRRACATNADCSDAGADGGSCQGRSCPVGVCGTPPALCP